MINQVALQLPPDGSLCIEESALAAATGHRRSFSLTKWERIAWAGWIGTLLFICIRSLLLPNAKTVYPIWSSTSRVWWSGGELYAPYRDVSLPDGFRYSPTFPILTTPFAYLSDTVGGVFWRCCCTLLYALAVSSWIRAVVPVPLSREQKAFLFFLLLPLSIQSLGNGQANFLVISLLLLTIVAVKNGRWNWASSLVALAFACKLYPLALGLLLVVLYPKPLWWRVPAAMLTVLAVPFLTHQPAYVLDQYHKWYLVLLTDDRSASASDNMYRDLWLLIRNLKVPIARLTYEGVQVLSGAAVALLCWGRQRSGWPERQLLNSTLALGTVWMMLLGPATESCTFILLAPSLAWSFVEVRCARGWRWRRGFLFASGGLFLLAVLAGAFPNAAQLHALGMHPLGTLCYLFYLLTEPRPCSVGASAMPLTLESAAYQGSNGGGTIGLVRQ